MPTVQPDGGLWRSICRPYIQQSLIANKCNVMSFSRIKPRYPTLSTSLSLSLALYPSLSPSLLLSICLSVLFHSFSRRAICQRRFRLCFGLCREFLTGRLTWPFKHICRHCPATHTALPCPVCLYVCVWRGLVWLSC